MRSPLIATLNGKMTCLDGDMPLVTGPSLPAAAQTQVGEFDGPTGTCAYATHM